MKEQLRQIYADLASGMLAQDEALERIKAIKLQDPGRAAGTLLLAPKWVDAAVRESRAPQFSEHHIVLCERPAADAETLRFALPRCRALSLDADASQNIARRYTDHATACFEHLQSILRNKPEGDVLVQVVVPSDGEEVLLAGLAGLLRTAALESPRITAQLILASADMTAEELARHLERERSAGPEPLVRYDDGARLVSRWEEVEDDAAEPPVAFKEDGVYLITGGAGGVGRLFAEEILRHAPRARVVLAGRSAPPEAAQALAERVSYRQADVTDAEQVARLVSAIGDDHGRLDGILHCAGILADDFILRKPAAAFRRVLAPKVTGTFHLDEATRHVELDFFVLFSSFAGAMGNPGQADYAAANAFLDCFAAHRNRLVAAGERHGRTRAIDWPLWEDGGMVMDAATRDVLRQATGIAPMPTASGLRAFYRGLALPYDQLLVAEGDLARLRRALLTGQPIEPEVAATGAASGAPAGDLLEKTEGFLRAEFSALLKLPPQKIDAEAALERYGIDSILAMQLTTQLEKTFGRLSKTLFFEYQTLRELARHLVAAHPARLEALFEHVSGETPAAPAEAKRIGGGRPLRGRGAARAEKQTPEPIAIVGLSGRYPEAVDLEAYWRNLREGRDCITEVPKERWDWGAWFSADRTQAGRHYSKWGGFISGVDEFDPLFFNISPKEAKTIDPQERLFLQHAWMALEDAGYTRAGLQVAHDGDLPGQAGVYAGVMYSEYQLFGAESTLRGKPAGVANSTASIANRVSYALNLHGPSMTVDTMCSSSLTAIHLACQDLERGRTNLAVAGGVNVSIHPNKYLVLSSGQFISSDGHCQSFGEGGDGYIPGEGVGVVILKRLSDAERDGDHIYAVIRGSALNHGGKTNGYTVPNPQAQATAIVRALAESRTDARHVSYVEAHGTGTKLGDPIEIAALGKAFHQYTRDTGYCLLGSAKSNIGHCESAAGIAGLTKVLLQMQHKEIVPSLHSERLNPHIDFEPTPFVVNQILRPWDRPVVDGRELPRIAGVSSFGAGGSNAHLVVEEYPAPAPQRTASGPVAIILSARTTAQLQQKAAGLLHFVRTRTETIDLESMAWTLQTGREAMSERAGFVVGSVQELAESLGAYVAGEPIADASGELASLVASWVGGAVVDWNDLYAGPRPRRMSLPAYPFAKDRYWIDLAPAERTTAVLHPLLHRNTSDLTQQSYSSTFREDDPFIATPAAAYLEMARAAVENAAGRCAELRDVVWAQPAVLPAGTPVNIALLANRDGGVDFEIYGGDDVVHCQGRTRSSGADVPATIDLDRLVRDGQRLETLRPPGGAADYVLHPALIDSALRAAAHLAGSRVPFAIDALRILAPCSGEMLAWLRPSAGDAGKVDIDLCDPRGNVAAEIRGIGWCEASVVPSRDEGVFPVDAADAEALQRLRNEPSLKVLMLHGLGRGLDPALHHALATFPYPVIAVLPHDTTGSGFRAAAVCDFMVCSEAARYGFGEPSPADARLFAERFGSARAEDLLFGSASATGRELRAQGWTCPVVAPAEVEAHATRLASALASKSQDALRLLKEHLMRSLTPLVDSAAAITAGEPEAGAPTVIAPTERIRVETPAARVLALTLGIADAKDVASDLAGIFAELRHDRWYRAVMIASDDPEFLFAVPDDVVLDLQRLIVESNVPVIAALTRNARGNAFLVAQCCDAAVYNRDGVYSAANLRPALTAPATALFAHRLGGVAASELLLTGAELTGADLRQRAGVRIAERERVMASAAGVAAQWARLPRTTLAAWKQQSAALLDERIASVPALTWDAADDAAASQDQAVAIPLQSKVVSLVAHPEGIAVVKMEDRDAKNMFSDALMAGVAEAFAYVAQAPACKVVVLTGYDSYFASGGTKDALLAIQQGKARFTDFDIHQAALHCKLPVVAAMQGHAIGAGWPLGMFADVVLLSDESHYLSPYMDYGFTPGAGATWILPEKLGHDLGRESLFTAQPATGRELRERGAAVRVLPRAEVEPAAMAVARQIAQAPRARLIALKEQLTASARQPLAETYARELAMHERTFVGRADTLAGIEKKFQPAAAERIPVAAPSTISGDGGEVLRGVSATLRTLLASELQMRESDIDEQAQFVDLGLDSISGVTWIRKINEKYETAIEATKVYSYPTLAQLSRHVKEEAEREGTLRAHAAVAPAPAAAPAQSVNAPARLTSWRSRAASRFAPAAGPRRTEAIAIVGIAGQFPQARNVDELWQNVAQGKNCITSVPAKRWDVNAWYQPGDVVPGKTNGQWLGALEEYDLFDPRFFNISPREAESMDPQQRLFLQACWHSIEDAGYDARALSGTKCGVFAGCAVSDYHLLARDQQLSAPGFTGDATSILAGRVSYLLNLQGPCLSIDTACSSSLVAIAHACDSLVSGSSDLALAGGVYVMAGPEMHVKTAQMGMLSPDGRCYTFDRRANGIVPGEAVGAVLLKRLSDAERDGDSVYAVIEGWGVNQDGKTNGITAPNTESQARLEREVYDRFGIDPSHIQLIEAHGTGTKLGDPIEVEGLKKAFAGYTQEQEYCALGSVKSNIGHCLTAAGIAGVAKLVMALQHEQLPPTINFERLNEHVDLTGTPFYVNDRLREWKASSAQRRRAAISSFGFSGTNAHLVLGEHVPAAASKPAPHGLTQNGKTIVPLSARTAAQLKQKAADLLGFVRGNAVDLHELAYTLQVGREPMEERLGIMAGSTDDLARKLQAWIDDGAAAGAGDVQYANVKRARESIAIISQDDEMRETVIEKCLAGGKLSQLMELWVKGLEVDWNRLHPEAKPRRIRLPLYPFAKERYWIDAAPVKAAQPPVAAAAPVLHPLLHSNVSDLSGQRYRSMLTADELPREAFLEMARAAIAHASARSGAVELDDVVWGEPFTATNRTEITIALAADEDDQLEFEIATGAGAILCQGRGAIVESAEPAPVTEKPLPETPLTAPAAVPEPRQNVVLPMVAAAVIPAAGERKKIALAAPGALAATPAIAPPPIALQAPALVAAPKSQEAVDGVFTIDVAPNNTGAQLRHSLERLRQEGSLKVLLLSGIEHFADSYDEAARQQLYRALVSFPSPVIGVVRGDAAGAPFLVAALCDFMVCSEEASYGCDATSAAAARVLSMRFGDALAQELLRRAAPATGRELRANGWTSAFVPREEVEPYARKLAASLAVKSRDALGLLKQHLTRQLAPLVDALPAVTPAAEVTGDVAVLRFRGAAELTQKLQQIAGASAVVLVSEDAEFLPALSATDARDLLRLIVQSEIPVIAALSGNARGNGWLAALCCDAAVYQRDGVYSAAGVALAESAFMHRFGPAAANEILLTGGDYSGAGLVARTAFLHVADDVETAATRLAESWATLPWEARAAWKKELHDAPAPALDELPELPPDAPVAIPLRSNAVSATAHPDGVVVVTMEDREAKNMFSDAFVEGLTEAFAHIGRTAAYKAVVLTGFDSYFASGGTKEGLVAIQQGKVKFTDVHVHELALDCKLPVVAAMQGHGIGAGWCLGMFADVVLLGEESRYVSPYMDYGFTPGAGATFILADRMGQDLARESLLTARHATGSELKARGLRLPILPRAEVVPAALDVARQIARQPRARLIALKRLLTAHVREALPETYRRELAMHEKTFVGQSDTLARIQSTFNDAVEPQAAPLQTAPQPESDGGELLRGVTSTLRALLAKELHLGEAEIDEDAEFVTLGLDSISGVTWVRNINEKYRTAIEATKIYRYPTLAQLSVFVREEAEKHGVLPRVAPARVPVVPAAATPKLAVKPASKRTGRRRASLKEPVVSGPEAETRQPIAVVGMSGRFPQARNLDEYWRNLEAGRNSISEVPPSRWDVEQYGKARWLGMLDDVDRFDPLFFRIAPQEAEYMDPQHRLFLQEAYRALEDAGYSGNAVSDRKCGVYLGMSINDYSMLLLKQGVQTTPVTANSFAVAAARIAYYLNLKGPAITIDTACSSSLVAMHLACQSLSNGDTDMALAGGVTLWLTPESHLSMSEAGMLSADGQCKAFDDSADGIVVSEGVGALVLKRLADAERDGDVIHGVILGSGINQDGRTNGITAPSVNSQIELERSVYSRFDIDPGTISYVEAHGTGTKLGDPIELEALAAAFGEKTAKKNYCAIGSVKSNIGHTASAAGVASVLKVLLSMRHRTLVPTLHVSKENPHFDFSSSPFYVCRERKEWEPVAGSRRRAAVSSFGYSGTNSHLVLEEYVPAAEPYAVPAGTPFVVPLSARTAEQLQQKARELAAWLRNETAPDLQSIAYTLQTGRDAMDERLALVVSSAAELAEKLSAYAGGQKDVEGVWAGRVEPGSDALALIGRDDDVQEAVDKWIARGKYARLAELWSRGLDLDWQKLHGAVKPRRTSLPTYPFATDRYWIDKVIAPPAPRESFAGVSGMGSIDDILSRIDGGAIETERAVRLLKMLV